MNRYLALLVPAYGVTLMGVPIAAMIDHLGRGATPVRALAVLPLWVIYAALFALPFLLPATGLAHLAQRIGGDLWRSTPGRLLFTLLCAGLGFTAVAFIVRSMAIISATAGATAAWVATSDAPSPRAHATLVLGTGLLSGIIVGLQLY